MENPAGPGRTSFTFSASDRAGGGLATGDDIPRRFTAAFRAENGSSKRPCRWARGDGPTGGGWRRRPHRPMKR